MAYEESYFFGKCNVVCEAETTADNGKTVTITDGTNSFTGTIVNRVASFFIPGKSTYTVTLSDNGTTEWTGTIAAGYGENIHIMLADGYESIKEKQIMSAQEIAAATAGTLGNAVPDADALKSLNENLTGKADKVNYTSDEADTGEVWIDGKHIYRKSYDVTSFGTYIDATLTDSYIDALINIDATWHASADQQWGLINCVNDGVTKEINLRVTAGGLQMANSTSLSVTRMIATVYYTKAY